MPKGLLIKDAIDENLKLIRDEDGTDTPLELSKDKLRVNGNVEATGYTDNIKLREEAIVKADGNVTLDSAGDITLDAAGADIAFAVGGTSYLTWSAAGQLIMKAASDTNDEFTITVGTAGATALATTQVGGTNLGDFKIDSDGDITLDSGNGNFIIENDGDEFSAANSAYAGMILGATRIYDNAQQYIATTTTFRVLLKNFDSADHNLGVTFVVPPSNRVKISVFLPFNSGLDGMFELGLATDVSATTLDAKYQQRVWDVDETDSVGINYHWIIDGSDHSWSAGESKTLYAMMKEGASGGRIYFGDGITNYGALVMEAIAYPATIGDGT